MWNFILLFFTFYKFLHYISKKKCFLIYKYISLINNKKKKYIRLRKKITQVRLLSKGTLEIISNYIYYNNNAQNTITYEAIFQNYAD